MQVGVESACMTAMQSANHVSLLILITLQRIPDGVNFCLVGHARSRDYVRKLQKDKEYDMWRVYWKSHYGAVEIMTTIHAVELYQI